MTWLQPFCLPFEMLATKFTQEENKRETGGELRLVL